MSPFTPGFTRKSHCVNTIDTIFRPQAQFKEEDRCSSYCLSFFTSQEGAVSNIKTLRKTTPKILNLLGDKLAKGEVYAKDGISSPIDHIQHYDLLEYKGVNLSHRFAVILDLAKHV